MTRHGMSAPASGSTSGRTSAAGQAIAVRLSPALLAAALVAGQVHVHPVQPAAEPALSHRAAVIRAFHDELVPHVSLHVLSPHRITHAEIIIDAKQAARELFTTQNRCDDCGGIHLRACPRIQSVRVKINESGVVTERDVTYWPWNTGWERHVNWPEDAFEDDDS
jgi:hypothetical protein